MNHNKSRNWMLTSSMPQLRQTFRFNAFCTVLWCMSAGLALLALRGTGVERYAAVPLVAATYNVLTAIRAHTAIKVHNSWMEMRGTARSWRVG